MPGTIVRAPCQGRAAQGHIRFGFSRSRTCSHHGALPITPVYKNMLGRDHTCLPRIMQYVAGFRCQPFSMFRRHRTRLMRQSQALPIFAMVDRLKATLPQVAALENVRGIRVVMRTIMRSLKSLQRYHMITLDMTRLIGESQSSGRGYDSCWFGRNAP